MRKMFLRTLVVVGVLWVVACMDDSTLPTVPQFDHIPGQGAELDVLEAQIVALFPEGRGPGGRVRSAALTHLRNIARQLDRQPHAAQNMAVSIGKLGLGQLNSGNLIGPPYLERVFTSPDLPAEDALAELVALLSSFLAGSFVVQMVSGEEDITVTTDDGHASVIIDDEDLTETILVSIQQIVEESCGLETELVQSAGCWRFNRFPEGDFDNDVEVTICVEDEDVPPSLLPFLRLHKGDPGEPIQALVATAGDALICDGFDPLASLGSNSLLRFARAVSSGLRTLLGPQPLSASAFFARGLGGLTGSFTDFGGVVRSITVAGIGANDGNREADDVFSSGDLPGSITRLTESEFNAKTDAELAAEFDVLLITWDSDTSLNVDWTTRLLPFLNSGGGVIYDGDPNNIGDLSAVVTTSFLTVGGESAGGVTVSAVVPGLTDGINGFFANNHIRFATFSTFDPVFSPFLTLTIGAVDHVVGLHGPVGPGCIVLTGPDQDFHAVRGALSGSGLDQYNLLVNELQFVTDPGLCTGP